MTSAYNREVDDILKSLIEFKETGEPTLHKHKINHIIVNEGVQLIIPLLIKINRPLVGS